MASSLLFTSIALVSFCKTLSEEPVVLDNVWPVVAPVAYDFKMRIVELYKCNTTSLLSGKNVCSK